MFKADPTPNRDFDNVGLEAGGVTMLSDNVATKSYSVVRGRDYHLRDFGEGRGNMSSS